VNRIHQKSICWLVLILCSNLLSVQGQSPQDLLRLTHDKYIGDFTATINASYKYYPDFNLSVSTDSMSSQLVIHDKDYRFRIGDMEFVREGEYYLICDYSQKVIVVTRHPEDTDQQPSFMLTDLFMRENNIKATSFDPGKDFKGVRLVFTSQNVTQADITLDNRNYIHTCTLKYQEEINYQSKTAHYSKLEIKYSIPEIERKPFPKKEVGIGKFLTIKSDGSAGLRPPYKDFKLTANNL